MKYYDDDNIIMETQQDTTQEKTLSINIDKIKVLGHKDRLKILAFLNDAGPKTWTDIQNKLQVNPNSLNIHLNKLVKFEFIERKVSENEKGHPTVKYNILKEGKKQYLSLIKEVSQ